MHLSFLAYSSCFVYWECSSQVSSDVWAYQQQPDGVQYSKPSALSMKSFLEVVNNTHMHANFGKTLKEAQIYMAQSTWPSLPYRADNSSVCKEHGASIWASAWKSLTQKRFLAWSCLLRRLNWCVLEKIYASSILWSHGESLDSSCGGLSRCEASGCTHWRGTWGFLNRL